jgi:lipopolysaccharide assembly protein A
MRLIAWLFWLVLFALFFWIALKNSDPVTLRITQESSLSAPLVLVVLATFVFGLLVGMVAVSARVFKQGREIRRLETQVKQAQQPASANRQPMTPPDVPST